jgi:hypothetical protein
VRRNGTLGSVLFRSLERSPTDNPIAWVVLGHIGDRGVPNLLHHWSDLKVRHQCLMPALEAAATWSSMQD